MEHREWNRKRKDPAYTELCGNDFFGAGARNRTEMELPPEDFESSASTSFTTPAYYTLQNLNYICESAAVVNKIAFLVTIYPFEKESDRITG